MIVNFTVRNFGPIKESATLSFEATKSDHLADYYIIPAGNKKLLKFGLIFGANASGKSSVLLALDFLRNAVINPFTKKTDTFDFKPFLFDEYSSTASTFFSLEFIQNHVRYLYEIEMNEFAVINEKLVYFQPNKATVFNRTTDLEKQFTTIGFGSKIKIRKDHKSTLENNTLWNNTVLGGFLKTNIESLELHNAADWFKNSLKSVVLPNSDLLPFISDKVEEGEINKNNVIKLLNKSGLNISDFFIKPGKKDIPSVMIDFLLKMSNETEEKKSEIRNTGKIDVKTLIFLHRLYDDKEFPLPYTSESKGTQRYYQFCGLLDLLIRNSHVIPIDELEASLHPDLLKYFLLLFLVNSKQSQIIATTHSREFLMERDMIRNDMIWFTQLKEDGSTELFSLEDFDSSVIRNSSSVYNAYKIGKLGAVPELSDYYVDLKE